MLLSSGIRLLGANTDMNEAQSLSYANDIIDIYSNSWGPCDSVCVGGPEKLTQMTLKNGAEKVSKVCKEDRSQDYTSNPIPTSHFFIFCDCMTLLPFTS